MRRPAGCTRTCCAYPVPRLHPSSTTLGRQWLDTLTQALALHREFGDRNREADTLRILAAVHRDAGRHTEALDLATTALALARETGNRPNEAEALNTLATVHDRLGRLREALDGQRQALDLAREIGGHYTETEALTGLAAAHHRAGHHDLAAQHAEAALTIARRAHFRVLEGDALTEFAVIHLHQDPARALDLAEQALAIHTQTGHRVGAARAKAITEQAMRHTITT
jgi:tetratricopeptide (TPR) repeat protein